MRQLLWSKLLRNQPPPSTCQSVTKFVVAEVVRTWCKLHIWQARNFCRRILLCESERQFRSSSSSRNHTLIFCSSRFRPWLRWTKKTITLEFHCAENFYCVHIRPIYSSRRSRRAEKVTPQEEKRNGSHRPCLLTSLPDLWAPTTIANSSRENNRQRFTGNAGGRNKARAAGGQAVVIFHPGLNVWPNVW